MKDYTIQDDYFFNKKTWNSELESLVCNFLEECLCQQENHLEADYFDEEEITSLNKTDLLEIVYEKTNTVEEWLKRSIEQNQISLDYQTFYVMDISHYSLSPFNTIVFQSNLYPLKTKETSKDLMKRFIDHTGVPYEKVRSVGHLLGFYYKIPYVIGEVVFIPEKSSMRGTSSWFALHHVSQYEVVEQSNDIRLYFKNQTNISVVTERTHFLNQAGKGTALSYCQQLFAKEMLLNKYSVKDLFYFKETDLNVGSFSNQVDQITLERYALSIQSQSNNLKKVIKEQLLTSILGDDHPNLNDILVTFTFKSNE